MAELIVEGELPEQRFEQKLAVGAPLVLGKETFPWERWASRLHVELTFDHDRLRVKRLPSGATRFFFRAARPIRSRCAAATAS